MNTPTAELLEKCLAEAWGGRMTFLESIQHMSTAGVRWYSANLHLGIKTHYLENGGTHQEKFPEWTPDLQPGAFNGEAVIAALRAIQGRKTTYPEFLREIAAAGTVVYTVHLRGKKAVYLGADGDFHVELFPQPK